MIEIKNIYAGYNKKEILKDISFMVANNSLNAIIGKNGAGKSTLLKVLCNLLKPQSGQIFINGKNINAFAKKDFAKLLAFMPQNIDISFPFLVDEFIMLGHYPYMNALKIARKKDFEFIKEIMDFLNISHLSKRKISGLSGGEKQKVLIAQTLAQDCNILVFDEPTAHLDIGSQNDILEILSTLHKNFNKTIIMSLHDLNAAGEFCENIILIDEGKVKKVGSPEIVLNYKDIEEAYGTIVVVKENPMSGKPFVIPVRSKKR